MHAGIPAVLHGSGIDRRLKRLEQAVGDGWTATDQRDRTARFQRRNPAVDIPSRDFTHP